MRMLNAPRMRAMVAWKSEAPPVKGASAVAIAISAIMVPSSTKISQIAFCNCWDCVRRPLLMFRRVER
ncbi:hypothetical protein AN220_13415 [Streptomyces nanshensis]|nr:hypothetical protein AN220_13415 [Streptomyces nanshensis]